jgi:hypothetical protein
MGPQQTESHQPRKTATEKPRTTYYQAVKVLLLTFKFNDLDLTKETSDVEKTFSDLGYSTDSYEIESEEGLKSKLENFFELKRGTDNELRIIYYHGHGGHNRNKFKMVR